MRPPDFGNSANKQMQGNRLTNASSASCSAVSNTRGDDNKIPAWTCLVLAASIALSKSSRTRTSIISDSSASARNAALVAVNCAALRSGMPKIAMRESSGTISFNNPTCLPLYSGRSRNIPVMLPPGRAKFFTYPFSSVSLSKSRATMGMLIVTFLAAATASGTAAKITFTFRRTRSTAASGSTSGVKMRYSIARLFPATYPVSAKPRRMPQIDVALPPPARG